MAGHPLCRIAAACLGSRPGLFELCTGSGRRVGTNDCVLHLRAGGSPRGMESRRPLDGQPVLFVGRPVGFRSLCSRKFSYARTVGILADIFKCRLARLRMKLTAVAE